MKDKLCPFCGRDYGKTLYKKSVSGYTQVWCIFCGAKGPEKETEKQANTAWNKRVKEEKKI